jgi:DNA-binding NarL/FixJ family response regulator
LRRLWRFTHQKRPVAAAEPPPDVAGPIQVVLVSADPLLGRALTAIATANDWLSSQVDSAAEAVQSLPTAGGVVVIVDRDLPRSDWRADLAKLAARPEVSATLLASAVADDYLWQEVSRYQGHDVLPKPFRSAEVVRAVRFARSWGAAVSGRKPV